MYTVNGNNLASASSSTGSSDMNFMDMMTPILGLTGSLISNKKNRKIAQKQMQQAWQMQLQNQLYQVASMRYSNKYNEDMYNKYSSPSALMRQYREAGLNPYAMMSPGAGGNVATSHASSGGTSSVPSAIPMQNPFDNFASDVQRSSDAINGILNRDGIIANNRKMSAEADYAEVQANMAERRSTAEIARIIAETRGLDAETKSKILDNLFNERTLEDRIQYTSGLNDIQASNRRLLESQADYQDVLTAVEKGKLKYLDERQRAELSQIYANVKSIYKGMEEADSRIMVNEATRDKLLQDTIETQWRASKMRVDAEVAKECKEWLIEKIKLDVLNSPVGFGTYYGTQFGRYLRNKYDDFKYYYDQSGEVFSDHLRRKKEADYIKRHGGWKFN